MDGRTRLGCTYHPHMQSPPTSMPSHCLDCGTPLASMPPVRFCSQCGQKTATTRLTLHDLLHDFWHALTHTDRSVLSLVRELALRPGHVARRYVDGGRKSYFNPFTFLIVVVGVSSVVLAASGFVSFEAGPGAAGNPVSRFLQGHLNLVVLFQVPVLALFGMLLFRGARLHFAEHLVLAAYTSGFRSVVFTVVVAPLWVLTHWNYAALVSIYLVAWTLYFAHATRQFHRGGAGAFFKGVLVALLTQALTVLLVSAAIVAAARLAWA